MDDFNKKFATQKELQEYARSQFLTLLQANKRINKLEAENKQLQAQVEALQALQQETENKPDLALQSAERDLCEIELKRLKEVAITRPLDLDEVKKMDLYVKNLYLAKGKPNTLGRSKKAETISESDLVKLVTSTDGSTGDE